MKKYPQVDVWHKAGSRAGWNGEDKSVALETASAKYGKPTMPQLRIFHKGYATGKANSAIEGIQLMFREMKPEAVDEMADDLWQMYKEAQMRTFGKVLVGGEPY